MVLILVDAGKRMRDRRYRGSCFPQYEEQLPIYPILPQMKQNNLKVNTLSNTESVKLEAR